MYLLKLALRPWRLAMFSQVFSAFAVGVLLFLIGFLFWMQHGLRSVLVRLEGEQVLTAYISNSVTEANEEKLLEAVKGVLVNGHGAEVKLVNTTEFIKLLKPQYPDLARELQGLGTDMVNVIPRYISVAGMLNSSVLREIKTIAGIESAESSKDRYRHIIGAFSTLRWVLRILIVGVSIALFTGLIHLSRTNGYLHRDALGLLKFWGREQRYPCFSRRYVGIIGGSLGWINCLGELGYRWRKYDPTCSIAFRVVKWNSYDGPIS